MAATKLLSDNGVTSGITGYQLTGGNDGTLQLQTTTAGGTATTAMTIGADQSTTLAGTLNLAGQNMTPYTGFKNRIINGAMVIDQRNAGAVVTAANAFNADRFVTYQSTAGTLTSQQVSDAPTGFVNSVKVTTAVAKTTAAGDYFNFSQPIEGYNIADFAFGSAGASAVALSFWVKSSIAGTFGGSLLNGNGYNQSITFQYTISAANTWEYKTILLLGATTGTWNKTNSAGMTVLFSLGDGSNYTTATTNTWQTGDYRNTSSNVKLSANAGATWQITGVQLEKGTVATSFDYRPYGTELALCQRYYQTLGNVGGTTALLGGMNSASRVRTSTPFGVVMRNGPSLTVTGTPSFYFYGAGANPTYTSINNYSTTTQTFAVDINVSGGSGAGAVCEILLGSATFAFSAEL